VDKQPFGTSESQTMNEKVQCFGKHPSWIVWLAILFAWFSGNATTWAQPTAQSGESNQGLSPINLDEQVRVIPQGGFVELTLGSETKKFGVSIMHNEGWIAPNAPIGLPLTFQDADADRIELAYDIPGNRRFHLRVKAIHGVPGAVVIGELENLGKSPVVEYFYWYWSNCSPIRSFAPGRWSRSTACKSRRRRGRHTCPRPAPASRSRGSRPPQER